MLFHAQNAVFTEWVVFYIKGRRGCNLDDLFKRADFLHLKHRFMHYFPPPAIKPKQRNSRCYEGLFKDFA